MGIAIRPVHADEVDGADLLDGAELAHDFPEVFALERALKAEYEDVGAPEELPDDDVPQVLQDGMVGS